MNPRRSIAPLAVAALVLVAACGQEDDADARACRDGMAAFAAATDFARGRLALPSLSEATEPAVHIPGGRSEFLGECRHKVTSYVQKAGATGAAGSDRFEAVVRYSGKGRWELEDLTLY